SIEPLVNTTDSVVCFRPLNVGGSDIASEILPRGLGKFVFILNAISETWFRLPRDRQSSRSGYAVKYPHWSTAFASPAKAVNTLDFSCAQSPVVKCELVNLTLKGLYPAWTSANRRTVIASGKNRGDAGGHRM